MNRAPLDIGWRRLAINRLTEHVKHPRDDGLANGRQQWSAGVGDRHATGKALRWCEGDAPNAIGIQLRQHFHDDFTLCSRMKH